ncbi:MAG: TetR/AcrR family transcriptional regulator [Corynebacterium provencense]|uniref:TetR/AcrR family transcriptional regulator n=2 Tax=Corynebacterium TaxID=1716 RepID=UPI002989DD09|nr:TetR/AcrR family transcriptional regulator [Corynebacterium provencense]
MTPAHTVPPGARPPRRAVGRPPRFAAEDAVAAALRAGIMDFTMSGVAEELGVTAPALYRLFPGRRDLVDACLRHIVTEFPAGATAASETMTWREVLDTVAEFDWRLFTRYPGLDRTFGTFSGLLRRIWPDSHRILDRLTALGYTRQQVVFAVSHISALTIAASARLHRRAAEMNRPAGADPAPRTFRASGVEITGTGDLTAASRRHWRQCVDLFLDQLATLEGDWPEQSVSD